MALSEGDKVIFLSGKFNDYLKLTDKLDNTIYFCEDTFQIFRGSEEYTKSVIIKSGSPYDNSLSAKDYKGRTYLDTSSYSLYTSNGYTWIPAVTGGTGAFITHSQIDDLFSTFGATNSSKSLSDLM